MSRFAACALAILSLTRAAETPPSTLSLKRAGAGGELTWKGSSPQADGSLIRPYFEVQTSADLRAWTPLGERLRARSSGPGETLSLTPSITGSQGFFRLLQVEPSRGSSLGQGGAEVYGFNDAFNKELQNIGQISPDQFAALFPNTADYLPALSWDPATAQFWSEFNANPDAVNAGKEWGQHGYRYLDTRLNAEELALFKKNGFVVSERRGAFTYAELLYNLWYSDLPLFLSCDAILQAWHRTFDAILEETEALYLYQSVDTLLAGMAAQVDASAAEAGNGVLKDSLLDADYFLTVARSLLAGASAPAIHSRLGQDARVAATLQDIRAEQLKAVPDFMGFCRVVDFSQFHVRGHYTHTEDLGHYFQCMMWLGRIDIPVAGGSWARCPDDLRMTAPRETGLAIVLWHLLNRSGQFGLWRDIEQTIAAFTGTTDSLTFGQWNGVLAGAGIRTLADVPELNTLVRLQNDLTQGELGVQNIRSDWFDQPLGGNASYSLPQTFTVFGQKFVPDSWVFSQTVFDSILWKEANGTNKVRRRVPGALDVAFAVLGNDQIVPDLVARMRGEFVDTNRPHASLFRDRLNYQHNLAAARRVMDRQTQATWDANIYMSWLSCLRALSSPTTGDPYPEAMRTRAWAMKTLNTQLASWTQLRHDTILYTKQSYGGGGGCLYPKGFVEPRVEFWGRLKEMATRTANLLQSLPMQGTATVIPSGGLIRIGPPAATAYSLAAMQERQVAHLQYFAAIVARLENLAAKELANECFTEDEEQFATREVVQFEGGSGPPRYSGWYPNLFYRTLSWDFYYFDSMYGSAAYDALVADVHTDVPCGDCGDPGSVLHQGVGRVNLLMIAIERGSDRFICAGPVSSHYEFEVIGEPRRLSDEEWRSVLEKEVPATSIEGIQPPAWTRSYLVPR